MKRYEVLAKVYLPCGLFGFGATWFAFNNLRFAVLFGMVPLVFWWFSEIYIELKHRDKL